MTGRNCILIADDQPVNLLVLEELLSAQYEVRAVGDGREALDYLQSGGRADLMLLDVMMPDIDGFEVCRRLKADPAYRDIPVIFLTGLESAADEEYGLSIGAGDFIHKPFSAPVVLARVRNHLMLARTTRELRDRSDNLERLVDERTREIRRQADELMRRSEQLVSAQGATISAFCALAEARDNETGNHILRTQHYVRALAEAVRDHPRFRAALDDETLLLLFKSAPLHDIGKVGIPDAILQKPGKLTAEEWTVMKRHCEYGRDAIVRAAGELTDRGDFFLHCAMEIAYGHHERWDGTGYPEGLAGEAIPVSARLMAVADVYDALISRRVYKPPFPHHTAIANIAAERGRHFDPDLIDALLRIADQFSAIASRYADEASQPGFLLTA